MPLKSEVQQEDESGSRTRDAVVSGEESTKCSSCVEVSATPSILVSSQGDMAALAGVLMPRFVGLKSPSHIY